MNILFQYYNDKNLERQKEIDYCLQRNLDNECVKQIINFNEKNTIIPDHFKTNIKYRQVNHDQRLTYSFIFDYCNKYLNGEYCILINADIFLTDINTYLLERYSNAIGCISRWEFDGKSNAVLDPNFKQLLHCHTQDAWVFKGGINVFDCDFELGKLGCDNAIAHRIKESGYIPINLDLDIKVIHYDLARGKDSTNFMTKHQENTEKPEEKGQFLVPSWNRVLEFKQGNDDLEFYKFICNDFTDKIKIKN